MLQLHKQLFYQKVVSAKIADVVCCDIDCRIQQSPVFNGKCSYCARNGMQNAQIMLEIEDYTFPFVIILFEADYAKNYASVYCIDA